MTTRVPRFRSTKRLISWLSNNHFILPKNEHHRVMRLPAESEQCFFKSKEPSHHIASNLVNYAEMVGPLGEEFENLLFWTTEPDRTQYIRGLAKRYVISIHRYNQQDQQNYPIPARFYEVLKGDDQSLYEIANCASERMRLPEDVESSFSDPWMSTLYAKEILKGRWSEAMERKIFEDADKKHLMKYIDTLNFVPEEGDFVLEQLKTSPDNLITYARYLKQHGLVFSENLQNCLKGCSHQLLMLAQYLGGRLRPDLEDTMSVPTVLLDYAKSYIRGRLPLHLEEHLMKDHSVASRYAFEVIRGFSSPQLPDSLHSMMVMKSWEFPNDPAIKKYIDACEGKC